MIFVYIYCIIIKFFSLGTGDPSEIGIIDKNTEICKIGKKSAVVSFPEQGISLKFQTENGGYL